MQRIPSAVKNAGLRGLGLALFLGACGGAPTGLSTSGGDGPSQTPLAAWVQYAVGGVQVRAVVAGACPEVHLDGRPVRMRERAAPDESYPGRSCQADLPEGTGEIRLAGSRLPVPVASPRRVVVVGDTGCRVADAHRLYQACNDPTRWPLAAVAASIAAYRPDLIVHLGDYIYRESACPAGNAGCAGTPFGHNQATWEADWFGPSAPLRAAAPIVFIRGNHESCKRAGEGWFRYLAPREWDSACRRQTEPWFVALNSVHLAILDTAVIENANHEPRLEDFTQQLRRVGAELGPGGWIATHRPIWGIGTSDDGDAIVMPTPVLQQAAARALPPQIDLVLAGHTHLAEVLDFGRLRPVQVVAGNGATRLVEPVGRPLTGVVIAGERVRAGWKIDQHGFLSAEPRASGGFTLTFRDVRGDPLLVCQLNGRRVSCGG